MSLHADAVDGDASREPLGHVIDHPRGGLGRGAALEVVLVDIQQGVGVGLMRRLEGDADEVLAEHLRENAVPEGAVFVEDLVDDVLKGFLVNIRLAYYSSRV